jgi:hypothetical protein
LKSAVLADRSSRHRPWYPTIGPVAAAGGRAGRGLRVVSSGRAEAEHER